MDAEDEKGLQQVLNQALEYLRGGTKASRAYVFRNFQDLEMGSCLGILAEACAPEILPHLNNPANHKVSWSLLPGEMFKSLEANESYGGPVEQAFASTPLLLELFKSQQDRLRSVLFFPVQVDDRWWGFVGFDDCETARQWDEREILMLRTASEMIGNTLQRWKVEEHLRETLAHLEQRVQERTLEFAQANTELRHEVHERQRFQNELEERLMIESTLAKISARL